MPFYKHIFRVVDGKLMPGTALHAFIKNGDHFYVTDIEIYKDGMIECWGLVDLAEFKEKVSEGWVRTRLPDGARVSMMVSTLNFNVSNVSPGVEEQEFLKEVEDEIHRLNERPTSADHCKASLRKYKIEPSRDNLQSLQAAYERVPAHLRRFLGDMDSKDWEYRKILGHS